MRAIAWVIMLLLVAGCSSDELSLISIRNETAIPIYVLPYSSDFTDAEWIPPGDADDFYSINCDLDAYTYFSFYYDSLIVYLRDLPDEPVKFFPDGTTVNYDPTLNPFQNPDVWKVNNFSTQGSGSGFVALDKTQIFDHYFCIEAEKIKSLSDTVLQELNPAF